MNLVICVDLLRLVYIELLLYYMYMIIHVYSSYH